MKRIEKDKARLRANARRYYYKNRAAINARRRANRHADPEKYRRQRDEQNAAQQRYREKHPERHKAASRKWYRNNKDKARASMRARNAANPLRRLCWDRKSAGMPTPTREMPPVCECCGSHPEKHSLSLDHCHATGEFRGWLCRRCNLGIGNLGDTFEGVQRALAYLRWAETQKPPERAAGDFI